MLKNSAFRLKKRDLSKRIAWYCRRAHLVLNELLPFAKRYQFGGVRSRSRIDRLLVRLQMHASRILRVTVPLPNAGEIHGLPKETCDIGMTSEPAVLNRSKPAWDFRPWLTEKTLRIWQCVGTIFEGFETVG